MERILLVEDDAQITASLSAFLQSEGFSVETATGETQAKQLVEQTAPGLLLVDVQLAEGSGFGVCAYARSRGLPVIFLTASGDESSVVLGLDMGADDYIAKPFRPRELVSRIRSVLRRYGKEKTLVPLGGVMADISHQLRTPLTAMRLTLSLLEQEELTPQRRLALMRELKKLTGRMEWLVEALLKMAQLDAGTVVFHPQDTTAAELVRRAAEPLEVPMEVRSIRFTAQVGEERLTCDVPWSTEALGNILKNCMEHAASWVQVTARETAIFTEITVQDDGPGFDPEELPRLFQRFYRGKNAGENNFGIGLSLSRQVLAQQNGTVQAENVLTGGARFILRWYKGTI